MISMTLPQYRHGECYVDGKLVRLTRQEAKFLLPMLMNPRLWNREDLMEAVYPIEEYDDKQPYDKIIDVFICKLRKKLGKQHVDLVWGQGYRIIQAPLSIDELTETPIASIMSAVTTTTQETEHNGQGQEFEELELQDDADAGAGHEEHLRLQEPGGRCADPVALYREVRLLRRGAEVDHSFGRRRLTGPERRRLKRREQRLLRLCHYLASRRKNGEDQIEEAGSSNAGQESLRSHL